MGFHSMFGHGNVQLPKFPRTAKVLSGFDAKVDEIYDRLQQHEILHPETPEDFERADAQYMRIIVQAYIELGCTPLKTLKDLQPGDIVLAPESDPADDVIIYNPEESEDGELYGGGGIDDFIESFGDCNSVEEIMAENLTQITFACRP